MRETVTLRDGRAVVVRTATADDAFGLYLLIDAIARERVYLLNTEAHWGVQGQRQWITSVERAGGTTLVAEAEDGEIVAWADLSRPAAPLAHHTAALGTGVLAGWRSVGLGRALLARIVAEARALGLERLELHVRSPNSRAIRLYESLGWKHEGVGRRAYKHGGAYEDRVQMGLWLGDDHDTPTTD